AADPSATNSAGNIVRVKSEVDSDDQERAGKLHGRIRLESDLQEDAVAAGGPGPRPGTRRSGCGALASHLSRVRLKTCVACWRRSPSGSRRAGASAPRGSA